MQEFDVKVSLAFVLSLGDCLEIPPDIFGIDVSYDN